MSKKVWTNKELEDSVDILNGVDRPWSDPELADIERERRLALMDEHGIDDWSMMPDEIVRPKAIEELVQSKSPILNSVEEVSSSDYETNIEIESVEDWATEGPEEQPAPTFQDPRVTAAMDNYVALELSRRALNEAKEKIKEYDEFTRQNMEEFIAQVTEQYIKTFDEKAYALARGDGSQEIYKQILQSYSVLRPIPNSGSAPTDLGPTIPEYVPNQISADIVLSAAKTNIVSPVAKAYLPENEYKELMAELGEVVSSETRGPDIISPPKSESPNPEPTTILYEDREVVVEDNREYLDDYADPEIIESDRIDADASSNQSPTSQGPYPSQILSQTDTEISATDIGSKHVGSAIPTNGESVYQDVEIESATNKEEYLDDYATLEDDEPYDSQTVNPEVGSIGNTVVNPYTPSYDEISAEPFKDGLYGISLPGAYAGMSGYAEIRPTSDSRSHDAVAAFERAGLYQKEYGEISPHIENIQYSNIEIPEVSFDPGSSVEAVISDAETIRVDDFDFDQQQTDMEDSIKDLLEQPSSVREEVPVPVFAGSIQNSAPDISDSRVDIDYSDMLYRASQGLEQEAEYFTNADRDIQEVFAGRMDDTEV